MTQELAPTVSLESFRNFFELVSQKLRSILILLYKIYL